ncbi:phage shock protein A [Thermogemmatispora aurantia]|uniref:Phage shock protein A n=1 Tax=Thermogemmatispora aurantia TaxID=2045279 RepID=A0A5J4K221_9CHLR|nr:PspA/IM30 family protein [Thermogemmatispora aurantia]GER81773.1 phage shock protein A [Thermogemmatispora aurantia]
MGLLSRLALLLRIRSKAALERAEDPVQVLDYSYQKQVEQLQQLRRAVADVATSERRLELQQAELQRQTERYEQQAFYALRTNREDLARLILQRRELLLDQLNSYEQQLGQVRAQKEQLIELEQQLRMRVEAFRSQKEVLKARYSAAQAQARIEEALAGLSTEMTEMRLALERAQEKILTAEARASALHSLLEQGTLDSPLSPPLLTAGGDSLDRELARLDQDEQIEQQLQLLKQRLLLDRPTSEGQGHLPPAET